MGKEVNVGFRAMGKEEGFECLFFAVVVVFFFFFFKFIRERNRREIKLRIFYVMCNLRSFSH